jgi:hypothetical protein
MNSTIPNYECRFSRIRRWFFTESRLHIFVGLAVPILSFAYDWHKNQTNLFARSGSIMCLMGGLLTFRRHLRGMDNTFFRDTGYADQAPFGTHKNPLEAKMVAAVADTTAMRWGVWYVAVGTVVWGYGDIFFSLTKFLLCHQH